MDCFVVTLFAMSANTISRSRSAGRSKFHMNFPPMKSEGAGKTGCPLHPRPVCIGRKHTVVTTGTPETSGLPCAMVLTVSFVISPVTGLCCHRHLREVASHELDASVGASGPHDFAVRFGAFVLHAIASTASRAPYVRDDREPPLMWARDGRACRDDLPDGGSEKFFDRGLDTDLPDRRILSDVPTRDIATHGRASSHPEVRPEAIRGSIMAVGAVLVWDTKLRGRLQPLINA